MTGLHRQPLQAVLLQVIEVHRIARLDAELLADVLEHAVVGVVPTHDQSMLGGQAVLGGDTRGHAGEIEGGVAVQLEGFFESLAFDAACSRQCSMGPSLASWRTS